MTAEAAVTAAPFSVTNKLAALSIIGLFEVMVKPALAVSNARTVVAVAAVREVSVKVTAPFALSSKAVDAACTAAALSLTENTVSASAAVAPSIVVA